MGDLQRRIEAVSPEALARLEAGDQPSGINPIDLVAALARSGLGDAESAGPPLVRRSPPHPKLAGLATEAALAGLFPLAPRPARLALAAGLLQILDVWDASHTAAQESDDQGDRSTAAYWHLIAHRREPDPGNALYWARRIGRHPIHPSLAEAAAPLLVSDPALAARLTPGGVWSAAAMIDLATQSRHATIAHRLQRLEMVALLEASLSEVSG